MKPATLDTRNDACASCRMAVSNAKLAAQIVAPGEEARFFDDIGCLAAYVHEHPLPPNAAMYVADHGTGAWVPFGTATFTRVDSIDTPMGSHLIAHADAASRDADAAARGGRPIAQRDVLGGSR